MKHAKTPPSADLHRCCPKLAHSVALLIARDNPLAAGLFTAGMTMFSGSIYALILNPQLKVLGPVTPLGGLCLIGGWLSLAWGPAPSGLRL